MLPRPKDRPACSLALDLTALPTIYIHMKYPGKESTYRRLSAVCGRYVRRLIHSHHRYDAANVYRRNRF